MMKKMTTRISALTIAVLLVFASFFGAFAAEDSLNESIVEGEDSQSGIVVSDDGSDLTSAAAEYTGVSVVESTHALTDSAKKFGDDAKREELLTKMQEAGKKTGWQFIIYTTDQGVSSEKIESCADNFYKNGSFQKNAILLVIDSKSNTMIIRNKGEVKDYFAHDDSRMESIISEMKPYLNSGDMYGASKAFVSKSVDIYSMGKTNILLISLKKIGPFAGIAGVIIAVVFFFITKSRYKNMGKSGTYDLASNSKVDLDEVEDTFVTQHTTVRTIKSDNDSGSGSSNHSDGSGSRAF